MAKKTFLLSVMLVISFCYHDFYESVWAQAKPLPAERVIKILIKGNSAISTTTILNRLKLKSGDIFDRSVLNKELKRLYATGYFADVFVETERRPEGVLVTFTVIEKPVIGKIEFQGNTRIKNPRLAKKISIKEGDLLDYNLLSQDVTVIKAYYTEQGYSRVEVDYEIEADSITGRATVIFLIDEGYSLKIKTIEVEGNRNIPDNEIKKYMATKTAWWFLQKGAFDEEKFQSDLDRIKAVYRQKGFLDVRVTTKVEYPPDTSEMHLKVIIEEGQKYLTGDIKIQGKLAFLKKRIRRIIKMRPGDPFDYERMKEDMENVRALYYDKGYMNADVDLQHKYNAITDRMDLVYDIQAGAEVYVGKINVMGNTKTRDIVVRRELRVYPGEKYDGEKLKKSKERIYNLGFFEDVYFETVPTSEEGVKDLNVTVKETKTGEMSFGGGYSSINAFVGFAQIKQRNFDIINFPMFTGGGQDLTVRAEMGSASANYFLSWTDPWILGYPYLFGFDVYRQEQNRFRLSGYGYDERRTGGSLRLGKELTDDISTGLVYNLEEVVIADVPSNATADLEDEEGTNWLSRLTWDLGYDTRDNRYSPSKGIVAGVSLQNAGGVIGGDKNFVKGIVYTSFYHSILENIVLELRGRTGIAQDYGDSDKIPIYERFFAGGARTIRGYDERGVGPRDPGTNTALGGEAMVVGNAEVTFPIFKNVIKGAVFYDVGNVWSDYTDVFSTSDYKQGAGVGVRVKTPIGPLSLDYGYPLSKNYDDEREGQFYFTVSHGF